MTRITWRSWVWNVFLSVCLSLMALIATVVAISEPAVPAKVIFWVMSAPLWLGAFRALLLGAGVREGGVVVYELTRTTIIPWGEIDEIAMGDQTSGLSAVFGVQAPIIRLRTKDEDEPDDVELNVLGWYRIMPFMSGPARRAVAGMNTALTGWRDSGRP